MLPSHAAARPTEIDELQPPDPVRPCPISTPNRRRSTGTTSNSSPSSRPAAAPRPARLSICPSPRHATRSRPEFPPLAQDTLTVIAANFACLWMRSPVSQRCEQRTHTVCLPDARPPVCTPSRKVTPGTHTSRACLLAWKALGRLQTMILHGVPQPRQRGSVTALLMSSVGLADDCCCCRSLTRPQTAHVPT